MRNKASCIAHSLLLLAIGFFTVAGCGPNGLEVPTPDQAGPGDPATGGSSDFPPAVDLGPGAKFQLVAKESDDDPAEWTFSVERDGATASVAEAPYTFVWDFGDGADYQGADQAYTFSDAGTYEVLVHAMDDAGAEAFTLGLKVTIAEKRNHPPIAHAGADQIVEAGELVSLYGGQSYDPERASLAHMWTQAGGPAVQLVGAGTPTPTFTAPAVSSDTQLAFTLRVSDRISASQDQCVVLVKKAPDSGLVALAGADRTVIEGKPIVLDGRFSSGAITAYKWRQVAGPLVSAPASSTSAIALAAPRLVPGKSLELMFELTVSAGEESSSDQVRLVVHSDGLIESDPRCNSDADNDRVVDCNDKCVTDAFKAVAGSCGCGKLDTDGDRDGTPDCLDECPLDPAKSVPGECGCGVAEDDPNCGLCLSSSTNWQNKPLAAQYNSFEFHFSATPAVGAADALIGLSEGPGATFADYAVLVRFNAAGTIDVRNGSSYGQETPVNYVVGTTYFFRVLVDVAAGVSTVFVQPDGGAEVRVANNFAFRAEQTGTTRLDNWAIWSDPANELEVCDPVVMGVPLTADAGDAKSITPGASTILGGRAIGGVPPYSYAWTPSTGLSSAAVAQPSASPSATTTYQLTIRDSLNATASDTVVVTVQANPLIANAGADKSISAGGSTTLNGTAAGGIAPYTYQWTPSTGLSSATTAAPTATPTVTTAYTLTVRDSTGATASDSATVTVSGGTGGGRTFYVAKGASNANDSNAGTEAAPWRTLAKATSMAQPGDTILVKAGVYSESLNVARSGTAGNMITFRAFPDDACTHSGSYWNTPTCGVKLQGGGLNINKQSYVRVEGFEVTATSGPGVWCQNRSEYVVRNVELVNNYIHDLSGYGIECRNAQDTLIEGNYIRNIQGSAGIGFRGDHPPRNVTIRGNTVLHVNCDGIHIEGQNIVIEDNILGDSFHTDCHQDALEVYGPSDGLMIRNNLIWDWTQNIYLSAETNYIRNTEVLGNVIWCDKYCAAGNDAPGVNCGPNVADITNLRIEGNTFHNVWNLITDGYARSSSYWITGLVLHNNLFANSRFSVEINGNYTSDYNLFWQTRLRNSNSLAAYRAAGGRGETNSIEQDPKFIDAATFNYRLRTDSPAIDRGRTVADLPRDSDGKNRPQGAGFDIGAYEAR